MYVIIVYDIEESRVSKILKLLREYLHWVQNSVFEGDITDGKYKELLIRLSRIIKPEEDSVIIYKFSDKFQFIKEVIGKEKSEIDVFY